jgi:tetratricopeptide (TPR) repeat protein
LSKEYIKYIFSIVLVLTAMLGSANFAYSQENEYLVKAYDFLNNGNENDALSLFELYLRDNPSDTKIYLQVGYIYYNKKDFEKAKKNFEYVVNNSTNYEEITTARRSLEYIESQSKPSVIETPVNTDPKVNQSTSEILTTGYNLLNAGDKKGAIRAFENYLIEKPDDAKIKLQLGYLYVGEKRYESAYKSFDYVSRYSDNTDDVDASNIAMYYLREKLTSTASTSLDIYFYNALEWYLQTDIPNYPKNNYISNLLGHVNFKIGRTTTFGPYMDIYLDSKSTPEKILNDRFFEVGEFFKWKITDFLNFELRVAYVREIDYKKNKFQFKPILSAGTRFGSSGFYKDRRSARTENFYLDLYGVALYDAKFENFFAQAAFREVLRYLLGGYSYMEFYLGQQIMADTKKEYYNNNVDLSIGMGFKPNLAGFPVLFVEAVSRNYLRDYYPPNNFMTGDLKNLFLIRAGFLINYNAKL